MGTYLGRICSRVSPRDYLRLAIADRRARLGYCQILRTQAPQPTDFFDPAPANTYGGNIPQRLDFVEPLAVLLGTLSELVNHSQGAERPKNCKHAGRELTPAVNPIEVGASFPISAVAEQNLFSGLWQEQAWPNKCRKRR